MSERRKNSAWFAIAFITILLAISAGVFVTFTYYQRAMAAARRQESAENLKSIHRILLEYERSSGHLPQTPAELAGVFKGKAAMLTHPSWPEQPGYTFICNKDSGSPKGNVVIAFESVPQNKYKFGRLSVDYSGKIEHTAEEAFEYRITQQEFAWPARYIEIQAEGGIVKNTHEFK